MIYLHDDVLPKLSDQLNSKRLSFRSAPLILSSDLRNLKDWEIKILQNKYVIAINQDPLGGYFSFCTVDWESVNRPFHYQMFSCVTFTGDMATVKFKANNMHIWHKNLADGCEAISFLNLRDDGMPRLFNKTLKDLGLAKQVIASSRFPIQEHFLLRFPPRTVG